MFEKVNPMHPDKVADRIAGAIVDLAYKKQYSPKVACEVLIGHGYCNIITESSVIFKQEDIEKIVARISKDNLVVNLKQYPQDIYLASNQLYELRCGDNGIFKGVPTTPEQKELSKIARDIYSKYNCDGKYILDKEKDKLIICQSNANLGDLRAMYPNSIINPLGEWTGGLNVDTGATNRKLGSDMGDAVTGGGLCLSSDSEYLAEDLKWHKISEYKKGKIAEWVDGKLHFVNPTKYIHNEDDSLIHIYNSSKLSMCLTPYHNMLIKTSKGNLIKRPALEIVNKLSNQIGNSGSILHTFIYDNENKSSVYKDDSDYKLQVAFCADGTILKNKKWNGRIRVKKLYKKQRLRELLKNKDYLETQDGEYSIFYYNFTLSNKSLYDCFKNENWNILKEEVFLWDGNIEDKIFRTTKKEDADFIQFVLQSYGECVSLTQNNRIGKLKYTKGKEYEIKSILYTCKVYKSKLTHLRKSKSVPIKVDFLNGKHSSYCFEVPSHNLIIRHNNKIFITGNCGKDCSKADVSVNIYCYLKAQELGREYKISCAIGDNTIDGKPYSEIVKIAKKYIDDLGGFEKFAEWGLI